VVRPNRAISHALLKAMLGLVEQDWQGALGGDKIKFALEGAFYTIAYTLALRGEEVLLVEMRGIRRCWAQATTHEDPHIVIALLGRFKNELSECHHLMPVVFETPRGLEPGKWVKRVLDCYEERRVLSGYMFRNGDGTRLKAKEMEPAFYDRLFEAPVGATGAHHPRVRCSRGLWCFSFVSARGNFRCYEPGSTSKCNRIKRTLAQKSSEWSESPFCDYQGALHGCQAHTESFIGIFETLIAWELYEMMLNVFKYY
jgi:hypothetical protein